MLVGQPPGGLGFSLNPFHYVAVGAKAVGKGAVATGKGAVTAGKYAGKGVVAVAKNPLVQSAASVGANAFLPGSGAVVSAILPKGGGGGGGAPVTPGTVDLQPIQDAAAKTAQAAAAVAQDTADTVTDTVRLPGIGPVKRSHLMIGGGILAGVVVLSLLTRKG